MLGYQLAGNRWITHAQPEIPLDSPGVKTFVNGLPAWGKSAYGPLTPGADCSVNVPSQFKTTASATVLAFNTGINPTAPT